MNFCPECGSELVGNAKFCHECGLKIPTNFKTTKAKLHLTEQFIHEVIHLRLFCLSVRHFLWYELFGEENEKLHIESQIEDYFNSFSDSQAKQIEIEKEKLTAITHNGNLVTLLEEYMEKYTTGEYNHLYKLPLTS
jgi:hypothetical protein